MPTPEATSLDTKAAFEAIREAEIEQDRRILEGVEKRLPGSVTAEPGSVENQPSYRRILARAHEVVSRAEVARLRVEPKATIGTTPVPMTVLSIREFEALVRTSVRFPSRISFFLSLLMLHIAVATRRYPSSGDRSRCYEGECDFTPKASCSQVNLEIQYPTTCHRDYEIPQIIHCIRRHESGRRIPSQISNGFVKSLPTFF